MPTFATVNIFCVPQECLKNLSFVMVVPANIKYFCMVYDYVGKADLEKSYWNEKKIVVTTHFPEMISNLGKNS